METNNQGRVVIIKGEFARLIEITEGGDYRCELLDRKHLDGSPLRYRFQFMPELAPEEVQQRYTKSKRKSTPKTPKSSNVTFVPSINHDRCFGWLLDNAVSGLTADEAVALMENEDQDGKPKVNCVAPAFTQFKQSGITTQLGTRKTRNGSSANVHFLAPNAEALFETSFGRKPEIQ